MDAARGEWEETYHEGVRLRSRREAFIPYRRNIAAQASSTAPLKYMPDPLG